MRAIFGLLLSACVIGACASQAAGIDDAGTVDASDGAPWATLDATSDAPADAAVADAQLASVSIDFHVPGTQIGDVPPGVYLSSSVCSGCHVATAATDAGAESPPAPYPSWQGSLMANAGHDPLFEAQLTTANQDVPGVGSYCIRCHMPVSVITGNVADPTGASLSSIDRDGVACHFCHSMIDPKAAPDAGPARDQATLASLADRPSHYGNAQFVLDPEGIRRGPYVDAGAPHPFEATAFVKSANMCGTCHDVGNVAISRLADGGYEYNAADAPAPDPDPHAQFPLERTFTEWSLSDFAASAGVDMGGRFGGVGATTVSTCQDCHMPRTNAAACFLVGPRSDLARHDFAGASAWVLEIIGKQSGSAVDQAALVVGRANAVDMLQRAARLELSKTGAGLRVRVVNESGHKLPTGHIEGRRVFVSVVYTDASDAVVGTRGAYDVASGDLDEASTTVFEMQIGLSADAAAATGLPAGVTTHMSLANTIEKDNRIPPRGFDPAAFAAAGAPVIGATYAAAQHWADVDYTVPPTAKRAKVSLYYQTVTKHYIEALETANHTNDAGAVLKDLWTASNRGAPILMAEAQLDL